MKVKINENFPVDVIESGSQLTIDDLGVIWQYIPSEGRISVLDKDGSPVDGGVYCDSFEDGIDGLKREKYITPCVGKE